MKIIQNHAREEKFAEAGVRACKIGFLARAASRSEVESACGSVGGDFPVGVSDNALVRDDAFLVSSITISDESPGVWKLLFEGRKRTPRVTMKGEVKVTPLAGGGCEKTAVFMLPEPPSEENAAYAEGDPLPWAGDGYFCTACNWRETGDGEAEMTVTGRELSAIRMTSLSFRQEHLGYSLLGAERSELVGVGVWSVPTAKLDDFPYHVGDSAAAWAGENMTVDTLQKIKLSEAEYELRLEARGTLGIGSQRRYTFGIDDRSNLANRTDYSVSFVALRVSLNEGGFTRHGLTGMVYASNWTTAMCPLVTDATTRFTRCEHPLRTMVVKVTSYVRGDCGDNLATVAQWQSSDPIFNGTVGNLSGNWLRMDIRAGNITDNRGNIWTKIDRYYRLAPESYTWNADYWKYNRN